MTGSPVKRVGFTLIELLVVVAVIAIISGLILPLLIEARDEARKTAAQQTNPIVQPSETSLSEPALPSGPAPIFDSVDLRMELTSGYHRIGMDVFTRYRVDCTGRVTFRRPGDTKNSRVVLIIPFPDRIVEARDVQLRILPPGGAGPPPPSDVIYARQGIYCACSMERQQVLTADVSFTALGREQLDYPLPPARQLRSVSITLNLSGVQAWTIPDDSLQPSAATADQIRWEFKNLVSNRRITVLIPGAEAPIARVLLLSKLVALAVLLFGAGFWFLSEQAKPGQLDGFRLGHFLLLALTYSLFFVIFAVLEFDGPFNTPVSMAVAGVFSLPLLVLHVSRVLNTRFAITRVVPLALFTLGLVVNGVYGAAVRDYVFIGSAIFVIAYVTLVYQSWAAGRERYQQERDVALAARRRSVVELVTTGTGGQMAELARSAAQTEEFRRSPVAGRGPVTVQPPFNELKQEYEALTKQLTYLPERPGPGSSEIYSDLERKANAFRERLDANLANLHAELAAYRSSRQSSSITDHEGEIHCAACGRIVPDAPFCQECGSARPQVVTCAGCGNQIIIPIHLLGSEPARGLFCVRCGLQTPPLSGKARIRDADEGQDSREEA